MKSLEERLAEKAARLAKEEKKLSGKVKSYRFALPLAGRPYMRKESDVAYVKERARLLVERIRKRSTYQLYDGLKEAINAEEKRMAESRIHQSRCGGINKYIMLVQQQDGTLEDDDGTIYVILDPPHLVREAVDPIVASNPCVDTLEGPDLIEVARLAELERRTENLSERLETIRDSAPTTAARLQQLIEESSAVEADLREVWKELESDIETDENADQHL
jgi:hypothetical protein